MRLSEVYTSTQGEGPKVGIPTIFVRFAGCNLRCPGWACDTQHAIDPKLYRSEWKELGPDQIFDMVVAESFRTGANNVCFTGGEPFLQEHERLMALVTLLRNEGFEMEVFTNGTIQWPRNAMHRISFVMDWKLIGSGEEVMESDVVWMNALRLGPKDSIKFTVASKDDLVQATGIFRKFASGMILRRPTGGSSGVQYFCGPVWGKIEPAEIVQWILDNKLPWRLNIQVHKYVWHPDARET